MQVSNLRPLQYEGIEKHRLDFHLFNRIDRQLGLDHPAEQKVLLLNIRFHSDPIFQQQFFGVQTAHV